MEQYLTLFYQYVLPALLTIASGLLIYVIQGLLKKYGGKLGVETQAKLAELLQSSVAQGVAYAEQWAKNRQKELGEVAQVPGQDKLAKAIEFVLADLKRSGIVDVTEKTIREKIEACLGFNTMSINDAKNAASETLEEVGGSDEDPNFTDGN